MKKQEIHHYGVNQFTELNDVISVHAEEIRIQGYTIVENVLNPQEIIEAQAKLAQLYELQLKELGDVSIIKTISDVDITRALLTYDDFFLYKVAAQPIIIDILKNVLGNYFILREQNGITNRANQPNYQLKWHRDLLYQHLVISKPFAISALFCLDDFNEQTGGTYLLPASHKIEAFPSESYIVKHEQCVNAKAGSAIVFDSMLYHRAGYNSSTINRRGINNMYALPFIKQQISLPKMLNGKYSEDKFFNMFLGYDSETDNSVSEWRMRRYKRINNQQ